MASAPPVVKASSTSRPDPPALLRASLPSLRLESLLDQIADLLRKTW
jgi:hypothetical protein